MSNPQPTLLLPQLQPCQIPALMVGRYRWFMILLRISNGSRRSIAFRSYGFTSLALVL